MDVNTLRIIVTVASFLVFLGIVAFAVYPGNRQRFHEAAHVPLNDGEDLTLSPTLSQGRGSKREERSSNV
jgi:cytochrome c oxidase cbb3-type subunit 4